MASTKQYLDQAGLVQLWNAIRQYYSTAASTDKDVKVSYAATAGDAQTAVELASPVTIGVTSTNNIIEGTSANWTGKGSLSIPLTITPATAKTDTAEAKDGYMSGTQATKLANLADIYSVDTTKELKLENNKLSINLDAYAKLTDISSVFKFAGTVATYEDLPEDSTENPLKIGTVYHIAQNHTEYVWVEGSETDGEAAHKVNHWEELGLTLDLSAYIKEEDADTKYLPKVNESERDIKVARISGLEDAVKPIKVNNATKADEASKVTNPLKIKEPGKDIFTEYDGSATKEIDLSNIATDEAVAEKVDKITGTTGNILKLNSEGGIEDTGISSSYLSTGGAINSTNNTYVTGKVVADYIGTLKHTDTETAVSKGSTDSDGVFTVTTTVYNADNTIKTTETHPVDTGARANKIETIKALDSNDKSYSATVDATTKTATIDLEAFALYDEIDSIESATITGIVNGTITT